MNSESTKLLILQSTSPCFRVIPRTLSTGFSLALARQLQAEEDAHARAIYEEQRRKHYEEHRKQREQRGSGDPRQSRTHLDRDDPEEVKKEKKKSDCIIM